MPTPTEAQTRRQLIDPALARAGWNVSDSSQVGLEIPVDGFDPAAARILVVGHDPRLQKSQAEADTVCARALAL